MRVLFDIVHPAHVHFYRHVFERMESSGDEYRIVARDKDVTTSLLESLGVPFEVVGAATATSRPGQAAELLRRDAHLIRVARRFRPDVIAARNPSGVQAARALRIPGVFDTDDGRDAGGLVFKMAAPFATVITTPACHRHDYGPKHRRYPGYKALAFLHPDHFTPDPGVRDELGVGSDPFFIVRLTAMTAAHDHGEVGLSEAVADRVVALLRARGHVFVSTEAELPARFAAHRFPAPVDRMLDAIAAATLVVGDSGSMAGEAAVLGTPNVFYSSFAGRRDYLADLEERFALTVNVAPPDVESLMGHVERLTGDVDVGDRWQQQRRRMLADSVDVAAWYYDLLVELAG